MWFADDGVDYHAFYLKASRALGNPERRHFHATIGHAVSSDLHDWREVEDALIASEGPAFDDLTTWTGSIIQDDQGLWHLFYTGASRADHGRIQRIGAATSPDLHTWTRRDAPVLEADPRWYEKYDGDVWFDEAWRDPWVFRDPDGEGWRMLITARSNAGEPSNRGVIGLAVSEDLEKWVVRPPASAAGAGFGQLEVPQLANVQGGVFLIFSCLSPELAGARSAPGGGGVWAVDVASASGPFDTSRAYRLTDEHLYAGRIVRTRTGSSYLLAFENTDDSGNFIGRMAEPRPVELSADGRLTVHDPTRPG
ncbi:glycoside hydrolase family protein [Agromyces sp. M3QZ16-3]|uniref:glycosyl hydrolase family 32 n=1 Tax=Agromyces sp. M3QZ16-3 TaxID=3447585 RepID=UPI003F6919B2